VSIRENISLLLNYSPFRRVTEVFLNVFPRKFNIYVYTGSIHCYDTLFTLLLLWTLELYLILSYRYEDLLISWSYRSYLDDLILTILSWRSYLDDLRSYLDLLILSSDDDPRYISFTLLLTCIQHAFDSCLSLTIDMHSTHVAVQFALRTTHGH